VWDGQRKYDPALDDLVEIGDSELMPIAEALATDFEAAFRAAQESFAEGSNTESPNGAHKECWPSAREFRHILFKAGQHQGLAAAKHLDSHLRPGPSSLCEDRALRSHRGPAATRRSDQLSTARNRGSSLPANSTRYSARSCSASAAPNASGRRERRTCGPASADITGIRSILADSAGMQLSMGNHRMSPVWSSVPAPGMVRGPASELMR
jgi:hypothetical protein